MGPTRSPLPPSAHHHHYHQHPAGGDTLPHASGRKSSGKDSAPVPSPSPLELGEDEYAKFSVTYVGSATRDSPLTPDCVEDAMVLFSTDGTAGGQAAVAKNTVQLQVTSLGVNLTDRSRRLFIHRNYPRKSIAGYCAHPSNPQLFAVVSDRPGFHNIRKVHVFRCGAEPVGQILDAIRYWLKMEPIQPRS